MPQERHRPRRRFGFALLLVALLVVAVEGLAWTAWWVATGQMFTPARAAALRAHAIAGPADGDAGRALATAGIVVHPYLGYVVDRRQGEVYGHAVSAHGFVDDASPLRAADATRFVVGITGGSVALQLAVFAGDTLAQAIARSPALAGRRVELVRIAVGGWKQPQQLFAAQLLDVLGGHFDAIVNLDGFNEIALVDENVPLGVPAWFPRSWARLVDGAPDRAQLLALGELALLRQQRADAARAAAGVGWSPTLQFLWRWRDARQHARIAELQTVIEQAPASVAATGPGLDGATPASARAAMVDVWANASRALHAHCQARGIVYAHFLQPNQYVADAKPIGADEAQVALRADSNWARAVADGYPRLRERLRALRDAGVPTFDLTRVFADHQEALYVDECCHVGLRGNQILAEHVAAGVRAQLEPAPAAAVALHVEPAPLRVDPLQAVPVRVLAQAADGSRRDVTGIGFGTVVEATPADAFVVGVDGSVRARRRGQGTLVVRHGALRTEVPVAAEWPDVLGGNDGRPAADGSTPALHLHLDGDRCRAMVTGLPAAPFRLLVVGDRPLPASPVGADVAGLTVHPLAEGAAIDLGLALPPVAQQPQFVRAYALAADGRTVLAASPTWIATRR